MIATAAQVKTRALALLDDPLQGTFTDALILQGYGEAIDALYAGFLMYQIPRIKVVTTYTLPIGTTSVSPATMSIFDFGELIQLEERLVGSTDKYQHVWERDDLTQRDQTDFLGEFEWRGDAFYFVGATTARDLRISYFATTEQPSAMDATSTGTDGALTFLSKYTAGIIGPRKGYVEIGAQYMEDAVGRRYNDGIIGGELFRLLQPMVRSRQRVQVAPKPYSVVRRRMVRKPPYIAAQQPAGIGMAPVQFTNLDGTITGVIDGSNAAFYLSYPVSTAEVSLNGVSLIRGQHYTHGSNLITFIAPYIPQPGADILVRGWA